MKKLLFGVIIVIVGVSAYFARSERSVEKKVVVHDTICIDTQYITKRDTVFFDAQWLRKQFENSPKSYWKNYGDGYEVEFPDFMNKVLLKILKENKTLTLQECIALDAVQKGHQINEETAEELLDKGLIEGESPNYQISLGVAKITHQLPEYTRVSGLERSKLKQMTLQFIQNAGEDGTMRDGIYEYLKVAMPSNKTKEQNLRLLGNILKELKEEGAVSLKGLSWYEVQNPTKKN